MTTSRREFLKGVSTSALVGGALVAGATPLKYARADERSKYGFMPGGKWRNWSGNVTMRPREIVRPTSLAELRETVARSTRIRAVGSGHSISTVAYTDETLMNTEAMTGIVHLDRERGRVTVRGGMKLRDFNEAIAALGFCLPSTGDTTYQSLAGLLATGTHGTGMKWGSCSEEESLLGMELVQPDGSLLRLDADRPEDLPMLRAARIGLGSFGIVHTVTLHVVPLHNLEHVGTDCSVDEAWDPAHWNGNDHYEFAYFPYTDRCYQFFRNVTDKPRTATKLYEWWHETVLENDLAQVLLKASSIAPSMMPKVMETFVKNFPHERYVDRADRVMTIRRKTPTFLMEVALPIANGPAALAAYREIVEKYRRAPEGERFFANLPLQIRFVREDRGALISCADGRDTCWFGLGSSVLHKGYEPMFREMEKILLDLGARPHWGKMYFTNQKKLHPGFAEWERQRLRFDPHGKFASRYLERIDALEEAERGGCF